MRLPRIGQWEEAAEESAEQVTRQMADALAFESRGRGSNALIGLALGVACVLLALLKIAPANSSEATDEQLRQIYKEVEYQTQQKLGCDVQIKTLETASKPRLPESYDELALHFSTRPGDWLPDSVQFRYNGHLVSSLNLRRYIEFELSVVHTTTDIAPLTRIEPAWLELSTSSMPAGSPVLTSLASAEGMMTRNAVHSGDALILGRLQKAWDVRRGDAVSLILEGPGLNMTAEAESLGNAYIGQRINVKRLSDNQRFSGTLSEGPSVLVETGEVQ